MTAKSDQSDFRAAIDAIAADNAEFARALAVERDYVGLCHKMRQELAQLRKSVGLNQADIAEQLEMSQSAVSRMEKGEGDIGLMTIARYAGALGLEPTVSFVPSQAASRDPGLMQRAVSALNKLWLRRSQEVSGRSDRYAALAQRSVIDAAEFVSGPDDAYEEITG